MAGILELMGHVQQQGEQGRARGLSQLIGKAYNAPPDQRQAVLGQVANVDGGMAMDAQKAFGQQDDAIHDQIIKRAAMVSSLYKANPQMAQAAYQGLPELAQRGGFGQVPPQLDDKVAAALEQMVAAARQSGTGGNVQSTYIDDKGQRVAIMRDGSVQVLGANAPNNQIIDTGNGFFGVNKGNLQAAPVMTGGQAAPQQPPQLQPNASYQTPSGIVRIDDVAPEDMETVQADMQSGGASDNYQLPPRDVSSGHGTPPALDYQNGRQLRSVPKPASPAEQQRLDMDRQRLVIAQQAAERAGQAAQSAADAKNLVAQGKAQKSAAAAQDTIDNLSDGVSQIDALLKSPGMKYLGSAEGDALLHIPVIRNSAKDANAQLDVIRNRVVLNTLASLKSLSTNGASGFGALSNQEGEILRNSIASLSNAQTNAQIISGLKQVQQVMQRSAQRIRALQAGQTAQAPQGGGNVIRYDAQGNRIQ